MITQQEYYGNTRSLRINMIIMYLHASDDPKCKNAVILQRPLDGASDQQSRGGDHRRTSHEVGRQETQSARRAVMGNIKPDYDWVRLVVMNDVGCIHYYTAVLIFNNTCFHFRSSLFLEIEPCPETS